MRHLLLILFAVAFGSCLSSRTTTQRVPSDLVIRYAEGGGFTGQWTGAMIAGNGITRSWNPRMSDSLSDAIGTLSPSVLEALWTSIQQGNLLNGVGGGEPGNMTRVVVISLGDKTIEVRWSYGTTPDARTQPYAALYEQCRSAVAALTR